MERAGCLTTTALVSCPPSLCPPVESFPTHGRIQQHAMELSPTQRCRMARVGGRRRHLPVTVLLRREHSTRTTGLRPEPGAIPTAPRTPPTTPLPTPQVTIQPI